MPNKDDKKKKVKKEETKSKNIRASRGKVLEGVVSSSSMEKTIVVTVTRKSAHPIYKKVEKKSKRYKARSEKNIDIGRKVRIKQSKPFSKDVTWRVVKVLKK